LPSESLRPAVVLRVRVNRRTVRMGCTGAWPEPQKEG